MTKPRITFHRQYYWVADTQLFGRVKSLTFEKRCNTFYICGCDKVNGIGGTSLEAYENWLKKKAMWSSSQDQEASNPKILYFDPSKNSGRTLVRYVKSFVAWLKGLTF